MTEYQVTNWREIPSLVIAREGESVVKISLPSRFQEAIDEAAMRLGDVDSDSYLAGWSRGSWIAAAGTPHEVATQLAHSLEEEFSDARLAEILDSLGKPKQ